MYNLLVAADSSAWNEGVYEFPRERVIREYTEDSISERYRDLNDDVVKEVMSFPALFVVEGEEVPSRVGRITSIKKKDRVVRIEFEFEKALSPLPDGFLSTSSILFELGRFEMSRTHWAIKEGSLWSILKKKGILLDRLPATKQVREVIDQPADISSTAPEVFIVHGHDDVAKFEMASAIKTLGGRPIILHEQASEGRTLIEKIERYTKVVFAVILYTPCDIGGARAVEMSLKPRARQNVVFEHGYLMAKLGRNKVMAFLKGNIETPTDIDGVVYIRLDAEGEWKAVLEREMRAAGCIR